MRVRSGALAVAIAISAAACTPGPYEPATKPTGTTGVGPGPTTSTPPHAPSRRPGWSPGTTRPIPGGHPAMRLVRDFVGQENVAMTKGKVDGLRALSHPGCVSCQGIIRVASRVNADGARLRTGYTRTIATIKGLTGTDPPVFQVVVKHTEQVRLSRTGAVVQRIEPKRVLLEYQTIREGSTWKVKEITAYPS